MDAQRVWNRQDGVARRPVGDPVDDLGRSGQPTSIRRGTLFGLSADAAATISALAVSIIVARLLGPTNRGVYFLVVLVATLSAMLGDLGSSTAAVAYSSRRGVAASQLQGLALVQATLAGATAAVILVPFAHFWSSTILGGVDRGQLAIAAVAVTPLVYSQIGIALLTGLGRIPLLSKLRVASAVAAPILMLAFVWPAHGRATAAVWAWLATVLILAASLFVALWLVVGRPTKPRAVPEILWFGIRSHLGTLAHFGFLRVDVLFVSAQLGPRAVGIYSLASVIAEKVSILGSALYGAGASKIGSLSEPGASALAARLFRTALVLLVPVALILGAVAHPLLSLVFGERFRPAAGPLILLLPGVVGLTLWYLLSLHLVLAARRPGLATIIQTVGLGLSVPAYYLAIRAWGMNGGAAVSSATYLMVLGIGVFVFLRLNDRSIRALIPRREDLREIRTGLTRRRA